MAAPFVFVYLPRTGTSPFLAHLARHLGWNEGIAYLGPWGDRQRHLQARPALDSWSPARLQRVTVLTGSGIDMESHRVVGADEGRYVTVLRDPADRIVADFNAKADRGEDLPGFWEWYEGRRVNQMTRHFLDLFGVESVDDVAERLKRFWFVTTTEHLPIDAPLLFEAMGIPTGWDPGGGGEGDLDDVDADDRGEAAAAGPASERRVDLTDEIRDRVHADNPRDLRLYKLALKRRASKRKRYGWDA